jgi:amino acid transporter
MIEPDLDPDPLRGAKPTVSIAPDDEPLTLRDWIFGRTLATSEEDEQKVGVLAGLPMLGLDGLASAAYGPEAALTLLIPLGAAGLGLIGPISGLIVALLVILYVSYRQTIAAYPQGGGSYTVAKENLGTFAGLLAAAALLLDYVLTVAVGISAGVGALISAVPRLQPYTLALCLLILGLIVVVNLRGIRESGVVFMVPTYLFLASMLTVLGYGVVKMIASGGHPTPVVKPPEPEKAVELVGIWILMRAFASGCTAMTGVEAVSNGVTVFRDPTVPNARRTLTAIIGFLAILLIGIAVLCHGYKVGATVPGQKDYESVLSQLTAAVIGKGFFYYVTIGSVLAVLALSANTGFADFPRLCRAIAIDGFLPNGFSHRGRRLVFSQGILVLAGFSAALLVVFDGVTDRLIALYAVGAFLAFTLSQAGMVQHWRRVGGDGARRSIIINGTGAICTGITLVIVLVSKFTEGAWITVLIVPATMILFYSVHRHYRLVAKQIASDEPMDAAHLDPPIVVLPIRGWSTITRKALRFGLRISHEVYALHIKEDEDVNNPVETEWHRFVEEPAKAEGLPVPQLVVVPSPYRRIYEPFMGYIRKLSRENPGRHIAVIVPELVEGRWYHFFLHNQTASLFKAYLLFSGYHRVVVINVPWYFEEPTH